MSSFLAVLASVTLLLLVATTTNQVFAKNICTTTLPSGEHPNWIGQANFQHMTNRGVGNYNVSVLLCWASLPPDSCGLNPSYIAITNESAGCVGNFDVVLQRPTVFPGGFQLKYGSKTSPKDMANIVVICNPNTSAIPLISRSQKFATSSPNKLGGTTYMLLTYSYAACETHQPSTSSTSTETPPPPPTTTTTEFPTTTTPSDGGSSSSFSFSNSGSNGGGGGPSFASSSSSAGFGSSSFSSSSGPHTIPPMSSSSAFSDSSDFAESP